MVFTYYDTAWYIFDFNLKGESCTTAITEYLQLWRYKCIADITSVAVEANAQPEPRSTDVSDIPNLFQLCQL